MRVFCPYCNEMFRTPGCISRHVITKHPEMKEDYIEKYINKRGW